MRPLTFTLGGEMQKIFFFFSLPIANATPMDMTAGSAGGTVIVIKSNDLSMRFVVVVPIATSLGNETAKPITVNVAIAPTKMSESR